MAQQRGKDDIAYVELSAGGINEGGLIRDFDQNLRDAARDLSRAIERDGKGKKTRVVVTVQVALSFDPDLEEHVSIDHSVKRTIPACKTTTLAKAAGGHIMVEPGGSRHDTPDQMTLAFNARGTILGRVNQATGEMEQTSDEGPIPIDAAR